MASGINDQVSCRSSQLLHKPRSRNYNVIMPDERMNLRVSLTRIGNSRGIRIPKPLIAQCGLGDQVELRVTAEGLVIAPHRPMRCGWKNAFSQDRPSEVLLLEDLPPNKFDREEWEW
jgi:antitoxin MazE